MACWAAAPARPATASSSFIRREKYGARVALFGRKINLAESPLDIVRLMRAVADGALSPLEAVKDYHAALQKQGLKPTRELALDSAITESVLKSA